MLLNFLKDLNESLVTVCVVRDVKAKTYVLLDYEQLKAITQVDPFKIEILKGNDANANENVQKLRSIYCVAAFRVRQGIPRSADIKNLSSIPDLITLGNDISKVVFNIMCSKLTIISYQPGGGYEEASGSWFRVEQDPNNLWIFQSLVDLNASIMAETERALLDQKVQDKVKAAENLTSSAFSIQQLLLDLTQPELMTMPPLPDLAASETKTFLQEYFIGAYSDEMRKKRQPLLGCAGVAHTPSTSTLTLTGFYLNVNPYVFPGGLPIQQPTPTQKQADTLNYLCVADHIP